MFHRTRRAPHVEVTRARITDDERRAPVALLASNALASLGGKLDLPDLPPTVRLERAGKFGWQVGLARLATCQIAPSVIVITANTAISCLV
jgi:hypothetical protein